MNEERIKQCKRDIKLLQEDLERLEEEIRFKSGDIFERYYGARVVSLKDVQGGWRTYYESSGYNDVSPKRLTKIGYKRIGNVFGD